jgi:hypothetical protein
MARIDSPDEQRRRSRAIQALDAEWTARQIEKGVDGPTPDDRPERSDYNQHVPALEAPADAEDEFWARMAQIAEGS